MKPIACPLPTEKGIYWLRTAHATHCISGGIYGDCKLNHEHGWTWDNPLSFGWVLAEVDPDADSDYKITAYFGSDSIGKWDSDSPCGDGVVVMIGSKVEEPE